MNKHKRKKRAFYFFIALSLCSTIVFSQGFDSGSDGSDGALDLTTPGTIIFDPATFAPALDPDGDGVYHFTTINVASGVTVRLGADILGNRPVIWLASGDVVIDGILNLNGDPGHVKGGAPIASIAGAGGYNGGIGATAFSASSPGEGPGGGQGSYPNNSAGHAQNADGANNSYGNVFLQPLLGGSGGAGGSASPGAGGGAGGGAILIASSHSISVSGQILANGGSIGTCSACITANNGGFGSGGAIRLMAETIAGNGALSANKAGIASVGRVRVEAFNQQFTGSLYGDVRFVAPGLIFPPSGSPSVQVTTVGGVAVPANPVGSFNPADVVINEDGSVIIELTAEYVPVGTIIDLTLWSESTGSLTAQSDPLTGAFESSTATASVVLPHGFTRLSIQASWTP